MVAAVVEERLPEPGPVTGWLRDVLGGLATEFAACRRQETSNDTELIDQIAFLEQLQAAAAAVRSAKIVRFAQAQVAAQRGNHWDPAKVGQGIADQVALACHVSPSEGSRRLERARALWYDLPATFHLMAEGRLSEWAATQVVTETRHLDPATRRDLDRRLVEDDQIDQLGVRAVSMRARSRSYAADPVGYTERGKNERKHRRIGIRPAPDTMSWLSAYLAVEQGVACWAALRRVTDAAKASGDTRTRDQIMADTLVARLTGQRSADDITFDVHVTDSHNGPEGDVTTAAGEPDSSEPRPSEQDGFEPRRSEPDSSEPRQFERGTSEPDGSEPLPPDPSVGLTLPPEVLYRLNGRSNAALPVVTLVVPWITLTGGDQPGVLVGHGPIPAPLVRELIRAADGRVRFQSVPATTSRLGHPSPSRTFRGKLKQRIEDRDQTCRDPYCDSPIRHIDHIRRWVDGGATSYLNGRGVCERGNYLRELPGWTVRLIDPASHTVQFTTPTGHTYTSQAPQPP